MKIFISHSSENKNYGEILVELLKDIGIKNEEIIFTSNAAYAIPLSENIFDWLKTQITEKPFVIYLLSEEYYKSIACLNEMGAAWIIENKHAVIFLPNFNLSSTEFLSGALDPREIGLKINDEDRIFSFIDLLSESFSITTSSIIINQSVKKFIEKLNNIQSSKSIPISNQFVEIKKEKIVSKIEAPLVEIPCIKQADFENEKLYSEFLSSILDKKIKEEELLLLHYIEKTCRYKLMTGWQEGNEISNIEQWEIIQDLNNKLSRNYSRALKRFELRGYTEISAVTGSGNTKELKIKDELSKHFLDLPNEVTEIIDEVVKQNKKEDDFPF